MPPVAGVKIVGAGAAIKSIKRISGARLMAAIDKQLGKIAKDAAERMKKKLKTVRPLSSQSISIRNALGFSGQEALIRSGFMERSIQAKRIGLAKWFAGIPAGIKVPKAPGAKKTTRLKLDQIARIHEGGDILTFKVTEEFQKFLKFLASKGVFGDSKSQEVASRNTEKGPFSIGRTYSIVIPARPFILPVAEQIKKELPERLIEGLEVRLKLTGGLLFGS